MYVSTSLWKCISTYWILIADILLRIFSISVHDWSVTFLSCNFLASVLNQGLDFILIKNIGTILLFLFPGIIYIWLLLFLIYIFSWIFGKIHLWYTFLGGWDFYCKKGFCNSVFSFNFYTIKGWYSILICVVYSCYIPGYVLNVCCVPWW